MRMVIFNKKGEYKSVPCHDAKESIASNLASVPGIIARGFMVLFMPDDTKVETEAEIKYRINLILKNKL